MTGTPVAARVLGVALDAAGRLPDDDYRAMAVRGGLLVDLAAAGRLAQTDDSIELDPSPTGWAPADAALTELGLLDGRTLDWWLEHSRVRPADLAAVLVAEGSWQRRPAAAFHRGPRYAVGDPAGLARDRALLAGPAGAVDPADVAVAAIAAAAGLAGRAAAAAADDLAARTGPTAWVCRLVTEHIGTARIEGSAVSSASQTALWSGLPY